MITRNDIFFTFFIFLNINYFSFGRSTKVHIKSRGSYIMCCSITIVGGPSNFNIKLPKQVQSVHTKSIINPVHTFIFSLHKINNIRRIRNYSNVVKTCMGGIGEHMIDSSQLLFFCISSSCICMTGCKENITISI